MSKILAILALLLISSMCATNKEILQQVLNGVFTQNELSKPTTIVQCIDESAAEKIVGFIGTVLDKASKGSITDLIGLQDVVQKIGNEIPQPLLTCVYVNKEFTPLGLKYGIDDKTDATALKNKIINQLVLHFNWFSNLNDSWKAGKYYQAGFDAATYAHTLLGTQKVVAVNLIAEQPSVKNKEIIQQLLNGLFEKNKLKPSTTIVQCIDEATAKKFVDFIGTILEKAAKGGITDLIGVVNLGKKYGDEIPKSVRQCLNTNAELTAFVLKYGINEKTATSTIYNKVFIYTVLNYSKVQKWFVTLNDQWKAGKHYQAGLDAASYAHSVLGIKSDQINNLIKFI